MGRRRLGLLLFLCTGALGGCVVDRPDVIDEGFWACSTAEDCGPDQGCAEGNVYSRDFCRPACDPNDPATCDGVCTVTGACLERCTIGADGSPVGCASEDFTCVRIDAIRDEGVCFPVEGCSRTADCASDGEVPQVCLNEALGLPAMTVGADLSFDNLYCSARPDGEGRCPAGYLSFRFANPDGSTTAVCYPQCEVDVDGPFCPPSTTCFRGFGELLGIGETPCFPGIYGLPCKDDTQCLFGRCMQVGPAQKACTETCEWADENMGGCESLARFAEGTGAAVRIACEDVNGTATCVPRYDLFSLCDQQLDCVGEDSICTFLSLGGLDAHLCLRACLTAEDCADGTGGTTADYRCVAATPGEAGLCVRRRPNGARCGDDRDCREGACCDLGDGVRACLRSCP